MGLNVIEMSVSYAVTWIDRGDITKSIMIRYPDNLPEKTKLVYCVDRNKGANIGWTRLKEGEMCFSISASETGVIRFRIILPGSSTGSNVSEIPVALMAVANS
jgi:hypothetical protein